MDYQGLKNKDELLGVRIKMGLPVKMVKMSHKGLKGKDGLQVGKNNDALPGVKDKYGLPRIKG